MSNFSTSPTPERLKSHLFFGSEAELEILPPGAKVQDLGDTKGCQGPGSPLRAHRHFPLTLLNSHPLAPPLTTSSRPAGLCLCSDSPALSSLLPSNFCSWLTTKDRLPGANSLFPVPVYRLSFSRRCGRGCSLLGLPTTHTSCLLICLES